MLRMGVFVFWLMFSQMGCAVRSPADFKKVSQRIEDLAQREGQNRQQIDDLQNRLFLLEDKVDTSRVALERRGKPPQLPVIRLQPGATDGEEQLSREEEEPPASDPSRESDEEENEASAAKGGAIGKSVVESSSVTYSGEARQDRPRPLLRLYGSASPNFSRQASLPGPDPSTVTERLAVVPVPKRAEAAKIADSFQPMREYSEALAKYKSGQYVAAANGFRSFLQHFAQHAYADNALYWLGECSYAQNDYRKALKVFGQVLKQYPKGNKAPDALLKMAFCYIRLRDKGHARTVLAQVVESFPQSKVARLASQTLAKMQ